MPDRLPDDIPDGKAAVTLRDEKGVVIYEALIDTTGDVNAQVKDMFQALAKAKHPLIKMTVLGEKD